MFFRERAGARFLLLLALCTTISTVTYADTRAEMTARDQTRAPSFSNLLGYVTYVMLGASGLLLTISAIAILRMPTSGFLCYSVPYSDAAACLGVECCQCTSIRNFNLTLIFLWSLLLVCRLAVGVELTFLYPFIACCGLHGIAVATVVAVMRGYRAQQMRAEVEAHSRRVQRALLQELQAMAGAAGGGAPQQVLPPIRTLSAELVLVLQPDYSVTSSMLPSRGVSRCSSMGSMSRSRSSSVERGGRSKGVEEEAREGGEQEGQVDGCRVECVEEGGVRDASGTAGGKRCRACGAAMGPRREQRDVGGKGDEGQGQEAEAARTLGDGPAVGDVEQGLGCCEGSGAAAAAAGEIASARGADGEGSGSGRAPRRSGEGCCPECGARRHRGRRRGKGRGLRGTAWALRYITPAEPEWDPEQCQPGCGSDAVGYDKSVLGTAVSRLSNALGAAGAGGGGGPGQRAVWPEDRRADVPEGLPAATAAGGPSGRWRPSGGSPRGWSDRESGGPAGGSPPAQRCSGGLGAGGSSVAGGSPPPEGRGGAGGSSGVAGGSPTQGWYGGWNWQGGVGWGASGGRGGGGLAGASSAPTGLLDEVAAALRTQRTGQRGGGQAVRDGGAGGAAAWRGGMARAASSAMLREVDQQQMPQQPQQRQRQG